ncbi:hypothetical protein U1Q18_018659 [Sarracenia purpurea var. burkii]
MASRWEDVEVNFVRTNGLFRRPSLRMRAWSWVSLGRESHVWRRDKHLCSAALLLMVLDRGWKQVKSGDGFTMGRFIWKCFRIPFFSRRDSLEIGIM